MVPDSARVYRFNLSASEKKQKKTTECLPPRNATPPSSSGPARRQVSREMRRPASDGSFWKDHRASCRNGCRIRSEWPTDCLTTMGAFAVTSPRRSPEGGFHGQRRHLEPLVGFETGRVVKQRLRHLLFRPSVKIVTGL